MATHRRDEGFEFDLILIERPHDNEFAYKIRSKNLVFCKQPPLTSEEIADGHRRPDNVVGSYAVYHSHKRNNHRLSNGREENYGCGKFGHIYRPKAVDDNGKWAWCDMDIADGHLVIIAPQEFLDNAKYPVTIDPNIGYTTAGASVQDGNRVKTFNNMADDYLTELVATDGTVTAGHVYCALQSDGSTNARMCVWKYVDPREDSIREVYGDVKALTSETPQWISFILSGAITKNNSYGVGATFNKYFSPEVDLYYDVVQPLFGQMPGQSCTDGANTCIPATLGATGQTTAKYSIYAAYDEDAPEDKMYLAKGWIVGNVELRDNSFQAELRGRAQHLQQNMLELYTPGCRATLGDARCGIDLEDSAGTYRHSGAVTSVSDDRLVFIDTSVSGITEDVFRFGLLTWSEPESGDGWTGNNAGFQIEVKKYDPSTKEFTLFEAMPYAIGVGDEFEVTWGCDKNLETCRDQYDNLVNFRGEPYIPSKSEIVNWKGEPV
jgi:uncharacterized phage protein (TIGR02218 family)